MKASLTAGVTAEITVTVTEEMCPAFDGAVVHRVYSTWSMAHHMEIAARMVLAPHLEEHEEGIGSHLAIDHVAPAPLGHRVRVVATATEVAPTKLVCAVTAYHLCGARPEIVGRGTQIQRIMPRTKLTALIARSAQCPRPASNRSP